MRWKALHYIYYKLIRYTLWVKRVSVYLLWLISVCLRYRGLKALKIICASLVVSLKTNGFNLASALPPGQRKAAILNGDIEHKVGVSMLKSSITWI